MTKIRNTDHPQQIVYDGGECRLLLLRITRPTRSHFVDTTKKLLQVIDVIFPVQKPPNQLIEQFTQEVTILYSL